MNINFPNDLFVTKDLSQCLRNKWVSNKATLVNLLDKGIAILGDLSTLNKLRNIHDCSLNQSHIRNPVS